MQTSLMFVDLPLQGFLADIDKIAIKMPKGQGEMENGTFGGFADLITALMETVPSDELQQSFDQLEWVPVEEGGVPGLAPLIDLTQDQAKAIGMAKHLLNEAAPETLRQAETLKSVLFPSVETAVAVDEMVEQENGLKPPIQDPGNHNSRRELAGHQLEQMRSAVTPELTNGEQGEQKVRPEVGDMQKQPPTLKGDAEVVKPQLTEGLREKEVAPVLQQSEGLERGRKFETSERTPSRMAPIQQPGGQAATEGGTGQQFSGNPEQESMQHEKPDAKIRVKDDASVRDFKPGIVENTLESTKESTDPLTKSGSEMRETQGPMTKTKPAFGERMESVSGAREMGSSTTSSQEMQNNVIRQIVQRMTLHTQGSQSTMTIKLKPEFLGQVQMQISTDQQQVIVRMATESMAVKEMVEQGLQHLKSELQQHGLEIDKFDVFVADDNEDKKPGQDWAGFRQALKRRQRDGMKQDRNQTEEMESPVSDDVDNHRALNSTGEVDYFA